MAMNILVTGGAGFIGSHTCVELLAAGHVVGQWTGDGALAALAVLERDSVFRHRLFGVLGMSAGVGLRSHRLETPRNSGLTGTNSTS